ncbi:type II toxin-antitoxin system RelE/ParE family toxin [Rhizobium rosettiformans]|uniref:type II toxin-antitoxin system RelE/ParE family toxin n=1 Tax=Rhizobium rosettiformans TaxID=1368430 RepID=UPI0032B2F57D
MGQKPTGRPGRVTGTWEKSVPGLPYILAYTMIAAETPETVVILRVIHAARDWQSESWPA